ncbi:uncharacterized protein LOC110707739 [Chenopodium quinoa]|uniref:uncharacterized protein LOC110707739 n=1 Tax=Chenopodium quinoa TaxID=63459 RepID=UPI000B77B87A|nr:uncharacterized protein LOC110707739 [Chenopodium quinoa]
MANVNRFMRNLTDDPRCKICNSQDDTTLHLLRDCTMAKDIWNQIGGPASIRSFKEGTLKQWIVRNIKIQFEEAWRVLGDGGNSNSLVSRGRSEIFVKWLGPPQGWLALNTDGVRRDPLDQLEEEE